MTKEPSSRTCPAARGRGVSFASPRARPLALALGLAALSGCAGRNPFEKDDVCFVESTPGATSRFRLFTPVSCQNPERVVGDEEGADYGRLRFEDLDADGVPEAIVESSSFRCTWLGTPCYDTWRIVLEICPRCEKKVTTRARTFLPALSAAE